MRDRISDVPNAPRGPSGAGTRSFVFACALTALIAYLTMNHLMLSDIIDQFHDRAIYKSVIYVGWLFCGFIVLALFIATAPLGVLIFVVPIFLVSLATNYSYVVIGKRALSLDVMEWLPQELGRLPQAWGEFADEIAWATLKAAVLLGVLLAARAVARRRESLAPHLARRKTWLAASGVFLAFHGGATLLQPPQMMAETNILVFGLPALFATTPELRPVEVLPARAALARKIVLVVDESVTHAVYRRVIAPTLTGLSVVDFGEAASIANCSAASNALLRWGVETARVRDAAYDPRTNPTIWAYAKAAGYRTVLIDGQSRGELQNYIGTREFALIDEFVPASSGIHSDQRIAAKLNEILRRGGLEFVYIVKRGVHFPYDMNYGRGELRSDASRAEKYEAAVSHASGGFFSPALRDIDASHTFLIYTSDHGQDLTTRSTHCNPDPRDVEYSVPLLAVTRVPALVDHLGSADLMRDRASHVNIFPTLLYAFGYEREWLEAVYGHTLAGPADRYLVYISLGWSGPSGSRNRRTVDATQFTESRQFPRRSLQKGAQAQ